MTKRPPNPIRKFRLVNATKWRKVMVLNLVSIQKIRANIVTINELTIKKIYSLEGRAQKSQ